MKPLYWLTIHGQPFEWTNECDSVFKDLKLRLISAPVLVFPKFDKPFLLDTDASKTSIGAVQSQQSEDSQEYVVAHGICTLSKAERTHDVMRKERFAVVTIVKHFYPYLLGQHFILCSEHSTLQWIYSMKKSERQLARWLKQLQVNEIEVVHRKGHSHLNANALSSVCVSSHEVGKGSSHDYCAGTFVVMPEESNMQLLQQRDENTFHP